MEQRPLTATPQWPKFGRPDCYPIFLFYLPSCVHRCLTRAIVPLTIYLQRLVGHVDIEKSKILYHCLHHFWRHLGLSNVLNSAVQSRNFVDFWYMKAFDYEFFLTEWYFIVITDICFQKRCFIFQNCVGLSLFSMAVGPDPICNEMEYGSGNSD